MKYLDLIQLDIEKFNQEQENKRNDFINKYGKKELNNIMWSEKHHELKSERTVDYSLSETQVEQLRQNGVITKNTNKGFGRNLIDLYSNDMPVFISTDSILFALHKFYDDWLKYKEETELIKQLSSICKNIIDLIQKLDCGSNKMLSILETYFMIPYIICNLDRLPNNESISNEFTSIFKPDELKLNDKDINDDKYIVVNSSKYFDYEKLDELAQYHGYDSFDGHDYHLKKVNYAYHHFNNPHTKTEIKFKYGDRKLFDDLIQKIFSQQDIKLTFGDTEINLNGSMFKPRGHYTESLELQKYFIAFNWFFNFQIKDDFILMTLISKLTESTLDQFIKFEQFINQIIGKSDGYTLTSFLKIVNNVIPTFENLSETINYIFENKTIINDYCKINCISKNTITKFGDVDKTSESIWFCLIGKGISVDNQVIQDLVDKDDVDNRKFPSVLDIVYTIFKNDQAKNIIHNKKNEQNTKYLNKLDQVLDKYEISDDSLYSKELEILRELSNFHNSFPFNTDLWKQKQVITQTAHYSEIRHDNVLYLQESFGFCMQCEHPDILIEPSLGTWKKMLEYIHMMKKLNNDKNHFNKIINSFEVILNKFIEFTEKLINEKPQDETLIKELKEIVAEFHGSGTTYTGWYPKLFKDFEKDGLNPCFEVSSLFTGVDDERGDGGIVHLGTGPVKLMYVNYNDTIYIGPTYSAYEFVTPYNVRLSDEEWNKTFDQYAKYEITL